MPRSFAQRFTSKIRSRARISRRPNSKSSAALCKGPVLFTPKSTGMASEDKPGKGGARRVTFGSCPRKAERRNLKPPADTKASVKVLMADFWSLRASSRRAAVLLQPPPPGGSLPILRWPNRFWSRAASTLGDTLTTMSTSGTATPKAVPRHNPPLAKAMTSTSGMVLRRVCCTISARRWTARSPSAVGAMRCTSSVTSASQPTASKLGAATGRELGCRRPGATGAEATPGAEAVLFGPRRRSTADGLNAFGACLPAEGPGAALQVPNLLAGTCTA
mmetsp:Transcript_24979/g.83356  ORF Transcript_24979/g.83356 Transcript_24979/m.83356 type:complete len:276 (+) Transcript_24979:699-1526(+)